MLRTSVEASGLGGGEVVSYYEALAKVERAFRAFSADLDILWTPETSSTSRDQAVFVDHATEVSVFSDVVLLKIDWFGWRFQPGSGVQRPVRPVLIVVGLVLAQDPPGQARPGQAMDGTGQRGRILHPGDLSLPLRD